MSYLCVPGTYVIILYMTDLTSVQYDENDVFVLRDWRRVVAHDIVYYDRYAH